MRLNRTGAFALSALIVAASALVATGSPAAAADTRFGNECTANIAASNSTLVMSAGDPAKRIPTLAPGDGVITSVEFGFPEIAEVLPTIVKVMRPAGGADFRTIQQTEAFPVTSGATTFDTRLPVAEGDALGLYGSAGTLFCTQQTSDDAVGAITGNTAVGTTDSFTFSTGVGLPIVATVEPDADGDGFGDTTQDVCPRSATVQTECPVIRLRGSAKARNNKTLVRIRSNDDVRVKVRGTVKVKGKKFTLRQAKSVRAGKRTTFRLSYPKKMRKRLAALPPRKNSTLRVVATTKDALGQTSRKKLRVRIPGTR